MNDALKTKINLIGAMIIFGSVGLFVKNIELTSDLIAFFRGTIGSIFLLGFLLIKKKKLSFGGIKKNIVLLLISGGGIGLNWIFLFEAYKYTTIANATLSYYLAPVFVVLLSPWVLKEKLNRTKVLCVLAALFGLLLIIDFHSEDSQIFHNQMLGILFGLIAAFFYAIVMLTNKFIKNISGIETTISQLTIAVLVLCPYILAVGNFKVTDLHISSIVFIIILGVIHTGIAYYMYFSSMQHLKAQTIAVYSYIDPISAIIFSAIFLKEGISLNQIIGGIIILGAAAFSKDQ